MRYSMFGTEIGDDTILHGKIGLTIFARAADVSHGFFKINRATVNRVATGVQLGPMGALPNKGMTGISARWHDTTLAFITVHFASDKKGVNRLDRRNKDACTSLRELSLHAETAGVFDVQYQHQHTFLLGDLNYRVDGSPAEVLAKICQSAKVCQARVMTSSSSSSPSPASLMIASSSSLLSAPSFPSSSSSSSAAAASMKETKNWRSMSYAKLYQLSNSSSSSSSPPALEANDNDHHHHLTTVRSKVAADVLSTVDDNDDSFKQQQPWDWVKRLDELSRSRRVGHVFYNFVEGEIHFPPSYRWARGHHHHHAALRHASSISHFDRHSSSNYVKSKIAEKEDIAAASASQQHELLAGDYTDMDRLSSAYTTSVGR